MGSNQDVDMTGQRFAALATQREADLRAALGRAGVDALELATGGDLVETVMRFAALRRQRSPLSGGALVRPLADHLKAVA